jgi:hypothetical protein
MRLMVRTAARAGGWLLALSFLARTSEIVERLFTIVAVSETNLSYGGSLNMSAVSRSPHLLPAAHLWYGT